MSELAEKTVLDFRADINGYLDGLKAVLDQMDLDEINTVMSKLVEANRRQGFIYIFGNGGSASTASHFVNDFNKGTSENLRTKFRFYCLNDSVSTVMAIANDVGYEHIFKMQLENLLTPNDIVIGISGSGNSKNVVAAIEYANSVGAETIGLVGYDGGKVKQLADCSIHVPIHDMQKVEDVHMIMDHLMMGILKEYLERCQA
ncbi:sugar isomerase (SIS) [Paenibacillus curdlanolyticus YK9]|uniref:Sugar isomerase (SIS) n=1 Tax=Paenibacillus curdlanolyticus YK9 TaxID=717606 RepID=E0I4Y6_9BACL|nr:SIS domain-containing protein [Paenibacillus curdlanolyticus]EFM12028.1 sugar isomerase (SIS) [Paenibacillus curdlanolyticus YK9]